MIGFLLLAAAAAPVTPADAPSIQGAWTGRIGNSTVNACFTGSEGHYFNQRDLKGIALSAADGSWQEHDGTWKIDRVTDAELEGVWLGSGKRLTIRLSRLSPLEQDGDCGAAYYAPIVNSVRYEYSEAKVGALPVRIVRSQLGQAFELKGKSEAVRRINDFSLHWQQSQAIDAFSCTVNGGQAWQSDLIADKVIGHNLLVAENAAANECGGVRREAVQANYLFDLHSGQAVDTYGWLTGGKAGLESGALRKQLEKLKSQAREECADISYEIGAPFPGAAGMLFPVSYARASQACNENVEVGYAKLAPYLSAEGKAFVRSIKH